MFISQRYGIVYGGPYLCEINTETKYGEQIARVRTKKLRDQQSRGPEPRAPSPERGDALRNEMTTLCNQLPEASASAASTAKATGDRMEAVERRMEAVERLPKGQAGGAKRCVHS